MLARGIANRKSSIANRDDFSADLSPFDNQLSHADRQLESPRPGAAGIEIEHATTFFLHRDMAVARNHGFEPCSFRLQMELCHVVQDVDQDATDFDDLRLGQFAGPRSFVNVATNSGHRRDGSKSIKNLRVADVAGMDDMLRAGQCVQRLGPKQAVRVGDDADGEVGSQLLVPGCQFSTIQFPAPGAISQNGSFSTRCWVLAAFRFVDELANAYNRPAHGAAANLLLFIARRHPQRVKASVEGFEHRFGFDHRSDPAGRAMLDIDGRSHGDFIALAVGLQSMESCGLHQPDHVGRRVHGWQLRMMRRQRVLELDCFLCLATRADGNGPRHNWSLQKEMSQ